MSTNHKEIENVFEAALRQDVAEGAAAERTRQSYRQGLLVYLAWCDDVDLKPIEAAVQDLKEYRSFLAGRYSRATIRLRLVSLRLLYSAFKNLGIRQDNPAEGIKSPKDQAHRAVFIVEKGLSPTEAQRFVSVIPEGKTPCEALARAVISLLLFQGLRADEVCRLKLGDLDRETEDRIYLTGKGGVRRLVRLSAPTRAALKVWLAYRGRQDAGAALLGTLRPPSPLIAERPATMYVRQVERIVDHYLRAADLKKPGRCAHALRHTFGIIARLAGAEREALKVALGHSRGETTDIYIEAAAMWQDNPADLIQGLLDGKKKITP